MNKNIVSRTAHAIGNGLTALCVAVMALHASPLLAAQTDISSTPITTVSSAQVKPNIMLLMDTSDSMSFTHMPDEVEATLGPISTTDVAARVGYKSFQCNSIYYNPAVTYEIPKRANGALFPTPPFGAAPYDVYDALSTTTVDLSSNFTPYDDSTLRKGGWGTPSISGPYPAYPTTYPGAPAYYYLHTAGSAITSYAAPACADADGGSTQAASDGGTWNRILITGGAQQTNFAIWYTYYRTRIAMIKSAASLAFTPLTDSFRVGLITVNPKYPFNVPASADTLNSPINPEKYLAIADFDSTQRNAWFNKLFGQKTGGTSPAREGLARVGRHYAGKMDGINTGMTPDPVQYSCQQNFTIMTTDGYWNDNAETVGAGPVGLDGTTKVGQQDGSLNANSTNGDGNSVWNVTPRPIWDGVPDGKRVTTNKSNSYRYSPCGVYFNRTDTQISQTTTQTTQSTSQTTQTSSQALQSTSQVLRTSTQNLQSTTQVAQSTTQNVQSTNQNLQSTSQNLQSTTQTRQSTLQNLQSTNQNLRSTSQMVQNTSQTVSYKTWVDRTTQINRQSTVQNLRSTVQNVQSTSQSRIATTQPLQSTTQTRQSTVQNLQSTTQTTSRTTQNLQSTTQNLTATAQNLRSTSQTTRSTQQTLTSTFQVVQSTTQTTLSTSQVRRSTSQTSTCADSGETCNPVPTGSCTPGGGFHCETVTTGPTLVATCNAQSASISNNFVKTTCDYTNTGPTPVLSCTNTSATPGNNYTSTACNNVTTTSVPVDICNSAPANAGNAYTATTCSSNSTGPTPTPSCAAIAASSGNAWTQTTCSFPTTGPTAVQTCAMSPANSGNSYTSTTCTPVTTTKVPVASCTASSAASGNSWTDTTCSTNNTSPTATQTCSASSAAAGNNWTTTSCSTNNTASVPVQTCTASPATAGNSWTATTCPAPATTGPVGVSSCVGIPATLANSWTQTICGSNNTTNVPIATCTASGPTMGNGYTTTTCPTPATTGPTGVQNCVAASASSGNAWTTTTCAPNPTNNVPVSSCTASTANAGNQWTVTTCSSNNTGPTPSGTCVASGATLANNWTTTTCPPLTTTNVPVASCTAVPVATSGNNWTTTTCPAAVTTGPTPVASCANVSASSGNSWTATNCSTNNTTNQAVGTCTASGATSGNGYTTTTCPTPTNLTGPTRVQTCTAATGTSGNGFVSTVCTPGSSTVPSGTCVPEAASLANNWVTTACNVLTGTQVPVQTCTPQTGNAGNNFITITCPGPIVTTNVPVASCAASGATAANLWTSTTCPTPVTTTNVPVATCTVTAAAVGNNWTSISCPTPVSTGPVGVATCTNTAAAIGNNWTTTTCTPNNTTNVPIATCAASGPTSVNGYTTTSCPAPVVTTNVPVATCTASGPTLANSYTTTTCPAPVVTTGVPVSACASAVAGPGNNYTSFSCPAPVVTGPTNVQTCTASPATLANNWVATSCTPNNTTNVPVSSCTNIPASAGNGWLGTTCSTNNTSNVPVQTCAVQSPTLGNGYTTVGCTPVTTTNVPVASCNPSSPGVGNDWVTTTCSSSGAANTPVASCTPVSPNMGNGFTTVTCPVITTGPTGVQTCTASSPSLANNYTTTTCDPVNTGPTLVASCTVSPPTAANSWVTTTCPTNVTGPTLVTTCNPASPNAGNNFTSTTCDPLPGSKIQYVTTTTEDTTFYSAGNPASSLPTVTTVGAVTDLDGVCYAPNVTPAPLPSPNPQPAAWTPADATAFPSCSAWPCEVVSTLPLPQAINSLADVAQYYYINDLRKNADWPADIARNDVLSNGGGAEDDRVRWQHMTTFTIALGVSGTLNYRPDYKSGSVTTGDFADIRTGAKSWPLWPDPALETSLPDNYSNRKSLWDNPKSIDDFWHAAVNGRGQYFSALNPKSVVSGLAEALAGIHAQLASGSAAATSNLEPTSGDNLIYLANYTTQKWIGDVQAKEINLSTGEIESTIIWSAQALLDTRAGNACDTRTIYLMRQGAANNLTNFTWGTSVCDGTGNPGTALADGLNTAEQSNFLASNVELLSQYAAMTDGTLGTADQRTPAVGKNLVNFLRGQRGLEDFTSNDASKLYRKRAAVLGDTVNGQPTYVRAPFSLYGDSGYSAFKAANVNREPMLYVPGNDGMLHAFYAGKSTTDPLGGKEAWAVIPSSVLPKLWRLADANYGNIHAYFVDGTPSVSDVYDVNTSTWKTILVGGLNNGGKGYYALDITDPLVPKGLWEFNWNDSVCPWSAGNTAIGAAVGNSSDCHIGQTFGKPLITKLADGTWVAIVTSGYNNVNAPPKTGDGDGYLYVLNAITGKIIHKIPTGIADATTPTGLAQTNNFVEIAETNNTTLRVYGTDLLGNIWRFDVNDTIAPTGREATKVGQATDGSGVPQPITIRPELTYKDGKPMVFVATGRLLGASDVNDLQPQSVYGFIDPMTGSPSYANLRSSLVPLGMTQSGSGTGTFRTVTCTGTTAQCNAADDGWVVTLPDPGERVNIEMKLRSGALVVGSNVPQISACTSGGYSWLNYFNYRDGTALPGGTVGGGGLHHENSVSQQYANFLIVGITIVKLPGDTRGTVYVTGSDSTISKETLNWGNDDPKRVSWREIATP